MAIHENKRKFNHHERYDMMKHAALQHHYYFSSKKY